MTKIRIKKQEPAICLVPIENQMSGRMIEIENPSGGDVKLDAFTMNRNQFG